MEEMKKCVCCGEEKPISEFYKNAWGVTNYCADCCKKRALEGKKERQRLKQQAIDAVNARNLRLEDFTPRELMLRLKELGYEGTLKYVKTEVIDISKL